MRFLIALFFTIATTAQAETPLENQWGWSVYQKNSAQKGNLLISPTSLYSTFALVFEGSQAETKEAGQKFLLLKPQATDTILPAFISELKNLSAKKDFILENAYSIWRDTSLKKDPLTKSYQLFIDKNYKADVFETDFSPSTKAAKKINDWVNDKTHSLIPSIVTAAALNGSNNAIINAVYFKAEWQEIFDKLFTKKLPFYLANKKRKPIDFLHSTRMVSYFENSQLQYLELPYKGREVAMAIILPKENVTLVSLEKSLTANDIHNFSNTAKPTSIEISLPKFKFDWSSPTHFLDQLISLGMPVKGDFTLMGLKEFEIQKVIHKTTIITDETGTEATAVTAMTSLGTGAPKAKPKSFTANHPFLFLIRSKSNGSWLFLGRLENP